ncbi:MAG: hypothetical protein M3377_07840 [Actinomycetota bacterium]|nr:hypothetical protein [Actinomycetota bacterium]
MGLRSDNRASGAEEYVVGDQRGLVGDNERRPVPAYGSVRRRDAAERRAVREGKPLGLLVHDARLEERGARDYLARLGQEALRALLAR